MKSPSLLVGLLAVLLGSGMLPLNAEPLVIAHRGASGYLPEHTLAAKALAYGMGADYVELDTVLSRDGVAIVFHDLYLDAMTDVARVYPGRARADGKHYVVDFDYAEIRRLALHERIRLEDGNAQFPNRFPHRAPLFRVHSLADELSLIRGLNRASGIEMGVYVEIKNPAWHRRHRLDISARVIDELHRFGYREPGDKAFIQSFDSAELRRIKRSGLSRLRLIQLIGENRWWPDAETDFERLKSREGLREIATYAAGVGPWYRQILLADDKGGVAFSTLAEDARAAGLLVHVYTIRADSLPGFVTGLEQLLDLLLRDQAVDGVITDHPDRVRRYIASGPGP